MSFSYVLSWQAVSAPSCTVLHLPDNTAITAFSSSSQASYILDFQGKLWATSFTPFNPSPDPAVLHPFPMFSSTPVTGITCSSNLTLVWTSMGGSYVWGQDAARSGVIGIPDIWETTYPLMIPGLKGVRVVGMAVGKTHAAAVDGED